ncbi:diguanylate cyclase [Mycolicibacterium sp. 018/SC-01/001]|uniref:GGDEF domain-containing protein n=1 Tax=Mycolicibacterium sp. 018/SC-01/001 TaxID=2592069 RepID=UPI00117C5E4B|nr:sensor domain-containing diguanylate cyclase [Mycolicibacterium sp. 018/SC-01/001]TRW78319.1 diguanylate cyclase [Mycolicibacterium sp. 018/SC-01/001]
MSAAKQWWALPDQYDWLSGYLHARRFARPVQIGMALVSAAAVLFPLNALYDPGQVHGRIFLAVSLVVAALHLGWLVLWLTRWPTRNQSVAYGLCFSASVAASTWIAGVPSIGLVGCTALALPGIYFAFFHSSKFVAVNLAIALAVAGYHSVELIRDGQAILAASMIVLVLQLNAGVPLVFQIAVHALGIDLIQSDRDPLTGLLNRRSFEREVVRAVLDDQGTGTHLVLVMIDLDRFKALNDAKGHSAGDDALISIGRALTADLPASTAIGRVGGEEFLVADIVTAAQIPDLAERARHAVTTGMHALTASVGTAATDVAGIDSTNIVDTLQRLTAQADVAMYQAKRAGGNRVHHHVTDSRSTR